jgi:hypothetical protein
MTNMPCARSSQYTTTTGERLPNRAIVETNSLRHLAIQFFLQRLMAKKERERTATMASGALFAQLQRFWAAAKFDAGVLSSPLELSVS